MSLAVLFAPGPRRAARAARASTSWSTRSLFAALALTGRWAGVGRAVLAPVLVLYAAGSEVIQGMIGRDATVGDRLADAVGVLVGLVAWQWIARRAARGIRTA